MTSILDLEIVNEVLYVSRHAKSCLQGVCASAKSDQGLCYPQTKSLDSMECFNAEKLPR